jgi:hypothetical protein
MNLNQSNSKLGGLLLAYSLLLGIAMLSSVTVQAQYPWGRDRQDRRDRDRDRDDRNRRDDRYGRSGGYGYNVYQIAQSRGYQDGLNTGASDGQRGQSYNPQRSHYYQNATYGYNSSYGNKNGYKQAYRDGFLRGYQEGFRRYGGYNRGRDNGRRLPFPFPW